MSQESATTAAHTTRISWKDYKSLASSHLTTNGAYIYRGQRDSKWGLVTTLHRTPLVTNPQGLKIYADQVLPFVLEAIEGWVGKSWNLNDRFGNAEFLAFLQHNGFPTPLLDWTYSPYIAAYFAFEALRHFASQSDSVAIFAFNEKDWTAAYRQVYDYGDFTPHVSVLKPRLVGNHKMALQQGCFTWTNVQDIESHIRLNEVNGKTFLHKYELDAKERPSVMRELSLMGISAIQIMPSVESVCKKAFEDLLFRLPPSETSSDSCS